MCFQQDLWNNVYRTMNGCDILFKHVTDIVSSIDYNSIKTDNLIVQQNWNALFKNIIHFDLICP